MKCPGQDMRFWKPGDIFDTQCPKCGRRVEFFKERSGVSAVAGMKSSIPNWILVVPSGVHMPNSVSAQCLKR